jgi:hypothetical protein
LTELEWRKDAAKMVVLIADAPPHGTSFTYTCLAASADNQVSENLEIVSCPVLEETIKLMTQRSRMVILSATIRSSSPEPWLSMVSFW